MFRNLLLIFALSFAPAVFFAQEEGQEILSHFSVAQSGNSIRIILTIESGTSSCNGIELERSTGGEFEQIALIPGICGGSEFEETYVLLDENPVAGIEASYRVNLGNVGRSSVLSITFVELSGGIAIFPNPASELVNIITSEEIPSAEISLFSASGSLVLNLSFISLPGQISIPRIQSGFYTILIEGNNKTWKSNLMIAE